MFILKELCTKIIIDQRVFKLQEKLEDTLNLAHSEKRKADEIEDEAQ